MTRSTNSSLDGRYSLIVHFLIGETSQESRWMRMRYRLLKTLQRCQTLPMREKRLLWFNLMMMWGVAKQERQPALSDKPSFKTASLTDQCHTRLTSWAARANGNDLERSRSSKATSNVLSRSRKPISRSRKSTNRTDWKKTCTFRLKPVGWIQNHNRKLPQTSLLKVSRLRLRER